MNHPKVTVEYLKSQRIGYPNRLVIREEDGLTMTMWPGIQTHPQNVISEAFLQLLQKVEDLEARISASAEVVE